MRLMRRNGLISPLVSIAWNIMRKEIIISTQEGRVMRPLLLVNQHMPLFDRHYHNDPTQQWLWEELLSGRSHINEKQCHIRRQLYHALAVRFQWEDKVPNYRTIPLSETLKQLQLRSGVMEYIDTAEIERSLVCMHIEQLIQRERFYEEWEKSIHKDSVSTCIDYTDKTVKHATSFRIVEHSPKLQTCIQKLYIQQHIQQGKQKVKQILHHTHGELHPSLMLGVMGMMIPFPEHSQAPRNQYSCHQSKQALGLYVSSFRKRMDHANHILHYPERALTGSRYMRYINNERLNYGTNVIVAIMCYGGFNIEDAMLVNKGSVMRGLFQSSYYFTEEVTEKDSQNEKVIVGRNYKIQRNTRTYDYSHVDSNPLKHGVIPPSCLNKMVKKDDVLIEAYEEKREPSGEGRAFTDYKSVASKDGYVDQIYLSDDVQGRRVAKVTLRNVRVPTIGDKFASRCGQKGTMGALVEEEDMPFIGGCSDNRDNDAFLKGIKPDIILNPHAIPSRMTIGQLFESLSGVIGTRLGRMGDSAPLCSNQTMGSLANPSDTLIQTMKKLGLNPHGNHTMYNGNTGEQLKGKVFIGPTYYQRLKQMPTDKYYHRRTGRADMVTRQPVGGRAQGGALKLGEMERDSLLSHGISLFTKEAFSEKSDGFQYHVGQESGDVEPPEVSDKVDYTKYTPMRRSMNFLSEDEAGGFREYLSNDATDMTDFKTHADVAHKDTRKTNVKTSRVAVPFAMRLLSQECEAMGVGMHMLPESHYPTVIHHGLESSAKRQSNDENNDTDA